MILDAALLRTQNSKGWNKGKLEQSRKKVVSSCPPWYGSY